MMKRWQGADFVSVKHMRWGGGTRLLSFFNGPWQTRRLHAPPPLQHPFLAFFFRTAARGFETGSLVSPCCRGGEVAVPFVSCHCAYSLRHTGPTAVALLEGVEEKASDNLPAPPPLPFSFYDSGGL